MGHDIIAGGFTNHQVDLIHTRLAGTQQYTPEQWARRFDNLPPFAAHLRRTSYDVLGKVVYRALGVEEHAYGGASGAGVAAWFSRIEVKQALVLLPSVVADAPPPIDTTEVEELERKISAGELGIPLPDDFVISDAKDEAAPGIEEEQKFFENILRWMDVSEQDTVRIYFG